VQTDVVEPGQTEMSTMNLPAGVYFVFTPGATSAQRVILID
jgi:hypothetical protein